MLNYNKIKSSINSGDSKNSELIRFMSINASTFYDKLKRESFTPNEVEKIAEFFKKPIAYFFDKENDTIAHTMEGPKVFTEPRLKKVCKECISKQNEIDALKQALEAKEELLQMYREKKGHCDANSA